MRQFVLVSFIVQTTTAVISLIAIAALDEKRWSNLFDFLVAGLYAAWAAILLWR